MSDRITFWVRFNLTLTTKYKITFIWLIVNSKLKKRSFVGHQWSIAGKGPKSAYVCVIILRHKCLLYGTTLLYNYIVVEKLKHFKTKNR